MSEKFTISQSILDWVENAINIAALPEKAQTIFSKWKNEDSAASYAQITDFSNASHIPFGYFFLETPPKENVSLIEHRTIKSGEFKNPSREFMDTYYSMKDIQEWTSDYLKTNKVEPLKFVGSMRGQEYPSILIEVRNLLNLDPDKPLKATDEKIFNRLRDYISNLGVLVLQNGCAKGNPHRPLDLNEFRGFALIDQRAPLVFINSKDSNSGKIFTLLHEFVHICMGVDDLFDKSDISYARVKPDEVIANKVASEILLPSHVFREEWEKFGNSLTNTQKISVLANRFGNSKTVIARKALDFGYINESSYVAIANEVTNNFKQKQGSGGNYYRTALSRTDKNFLSYLNDSVIDGSTSYTEAFRLTATSAKGYPKLMEAMKAKTL